eukprot:m.242188 g.242188  ORF g.242188 m.242188 type:complete len:1449 (-) comp17453_c0_seq21:1230-5576(-)
MADWEPDSYIDDEDDMLVRSPSYMDAVGINRGQMGIHNDAAHHHVASAGILPDSSPMGAGSASQQLTRTVSMSSINRNSQPPAPAPGTKSRDTNPAYPGFFHPLDRDIWSFRRLYDYITFSYLNPFMRLGATRQLSPEDLYPVPSLDEAYHLTESLEGAWKEQADKPNGSLLKAFIGSFYWRWSLASAMLLIEAILQVFEPYMLGRIISSTANGGSDQEVYGYAGGLVAAVLVHALLHHVAFLESWRLGYQMMAAATGLVFRKSLRITKQSFAKVSTGHVVNLVSNDVERFIQGAIPIPFLYIAPIQTAIAAYIAWEQLGPSTMTSIGVYILCVPLNMFLGKVFASLRSRTADVTDERVKVVNEVLGGMRVLKMYGWEEPFRQLVQRIRGQELKTIRQTNVIRGSNMAFYFISGTLTAFLSLMTYDLLGNELTAEKVFTSISVLQSIRLSIALFFPIGVQSASEIGVTMRRIENFLRLPEHPALKDGDNVSQGRRTFRPIPKDAENDQVKGDKANQGMSRLQPLNLDTEDLDGGDDTILEIVNMSAAWLDKPTLRNINLRAKAGSLVTVVGPVGAGKSSLLMAMLGELLPSSGTVTMEGPVGYASQEAWIMSDTIQNNITFGSKWDPEWYQQVVTACQFGPDLALFDAGSSTQVGEKGLTLSGGQRARLSLCRAVYSKADIYLLDDPLSAVDSKVGRALFEQCLRGLLKDKLVVLVTHQLQFLKDADCIMVLSTDGSVDSQGTYKELMQGGSALADILAEHEAEEQAHAQEAQPNSKRMSTSGHENEDKPTGQIVAEEGRKEGVVGLGTYWDYLKSAGSRPFIFFWAVLCVGTQALQLLADWWLSRWVDQSPDDRDDDSNLIVYGALVAAFTIAAFARAALFMSSAAKASAHLNNVSFQAVVRTDVRFFDINPVGRILNRFSKDMGFIDDLLPTTMLDLLQLSVLIVGTYLLVCSLNPWMFILVPVLSFVFLRVNSYYLQTAREVKRLEAVARSPVFSHFSSTLNGLATLRSHNASLRFQRLFESYQNGHGRAYSIFVNTSRWLGFRLDAITLVFMISVIFTTVALRDDLGAGRLGLIIAYVLQLTNVFQWTVRQSAELENQMTSVERVVEYSHLPPEEEFVNSPKLEDADQALVAKCDAEEWPEVGQLTFKKLSLRYAPGEPLRLSNISCVIPYGSRVGIVGRTGAGKSSLLAALFRLAPTEGDIILDGTPSSAIPLEILRRKLSVIPQDPVLFSGSVRRNLDPFERHTDADLWRALELVQLDATVKELDGALDAPMSEAGSNFSVGQRQLVCMARAMLKHSKVLIMDEATANVDTETDRLIQTTLREQFQECTVLTIAHRLHTVLDSDLIMVMDKGQLVEFAAPDVLLDEPGIFASLVSQARLKRDSVVSAAVRRRSSRPSWYSMPGFDTGVAGQLELLASVEESLEEFGPRLGEYSRIFTSQKPK